jgi:transposase-like protein
LLYTWSSPTNLSNPIYTDADKARAHLEALLWPNGPVCPHCGVADNAAAMNGRSTRPGVYKCRDCRQPFSVTVGTIFERSKIPLNKWLLATHLLACSKKGISSHQIHRMLGVTYKTAWFMTHRIREAMKPATGTPPMGGEGKTVEADETYLTKSPKTRKPVGQALHAKPARQVLSLVERGGNIRSKYLDDKNIRDALDEHLDMRSRLVTDGSTTCKTVMPNAS